MKTLIVFLFLTLTAVFQQDEVYHIIKVEGTIYITSTGKKLQPGDKIKPSDQLEFASADASALVISNTKGKFTLQIPENEDFFDESKLFALATNAATQVSARTQLSTRLPFDSEVQNLKEYLGEDDFTIIGNELQVQLGESKYPIDENNFFLLRYNIGESSVTTKPEIHNQSIIFSRNTLLENADKNKIEGVEVFQVNKNSGDTEYITTINLIFINSEELQKEFELIVEILKELGESKDAITEYLIEYFTDIYGITDMNNLSNFINQLHSGT